MAPSLLAQTGRSGPSWRRRRRWWPRGPCWRWSGWRKTGCRQRGSRRVEVLVPCPAWTSRRGCSAPPRAAPSPSPNPTRRRFSRARGPLCCCQTPQPWPAVGSQHGPGPIPDTGMTLPSAGMWLSHPQHSPTRLFWGCRRCPPIKLPAAALLAHPLARCGHGNVAAGDTLTLPGDSRVPRWSGTGLQAWGGVHVWGHTCVRKGGCSGVQTPGRWAQPGCGRRGHGHGCTHTHPCGEIHVSTPVCRYTGREGRTDRRTAVCVLKLDLPLPAGPLSALCPLPLGQNPVAPTAAPRARPGGQSIHEPHLGSGWGTGDGIWAMWLDHPHHVPLVGTLSPCPRAHSPPLGEPPWAGWS